MLERTSLEKKSFHCDSGFQGLVLGSTWLSCFWTVHQGREHVLAEKEVRLVVDRRKAERKGTETYTHSTT